MTSGDVKRVFHFSASDFATIVTTTTYVDKSLMIRDFYNASSRILITAPPRFGKSINMDMIKRFFEIEVDTLGNPKAVHTTNNYNLFKNYNLEICKEVVFLNEHFGKYPVVHMDFKLLGSVNTSAKILNAFKIIVQNSFNQHSYILQSSRREDVFNGITGINVNEFRKYVSDGITKDVDGLSLANCFNHLCIILKKFFGQKVFVLIDSYDSFLDSPVIKNRTGYESIISFVKSSVCQLLNNLNCVERVLITGLLPVIGEGFLSDNIERCHFLDSHPFTKYYGLTSAEVDSVLRKIIEYDEEREEVKKTINVHCSAYETRNRDFSVYNVWSVLQYVCRRRVQSYWCERRYINKFKKCFKVESIRQKLEELLLCKEVELDTLQPLTMTDVLKVNCIEDTTSGEDIEDEHLSIGGELLLALLYHFGYLSVFGEMGRRVVCVFIPSEEIKYELAKAVMDENRELYSSPHMNDILSALDAFRPDATDLEQNCETLRKNLYSLYQNNTFQFTRVLECLFMNLVTRAEYSQVMGYTFGPNAGTAVLLQNRQQVTICVARDGVQSAEITHQEVINDDDLEHIFDMFNDVCGEVIISFGSNGTIAYSYYFKTGDSLLEVRTLP